ncbi:MAG: hypothetical protein HN348_26385, partial [Proteobacteria bacterium]|nr:hypothetical protein [Pseudomonadota bacterium]
HFQLVVGFGDQGSTSPTLNDCDSFLLPLTVDQGYQIWSVPEEPSVDPPL